MGIIHTKQISFDFEKSCEKLALVYAKCKLEEAISTRKFSNSNIPIEIAQMEYLADEYYSSLGYFANLAEESVKSLVDPE